jgi:hypothetical protein
MLSDSELMALAALAMGDAAACTANNAMAAACGREFSYFSSDAYDRLHVEMQRRQRPARCEPWCGRDEIDVPDGAVTYVKRVGQRVAAFCSFSCRTAAPAVSP